jgi:phage tail sheath gpL-like
MSNPKVNLALGSSPGVGINGRHDHIIGTLPVANPYAGSTVEKVQLKTVAELDAIFGTNSDLRNRVEKYLNANDRKSRVDVQCLEEDDDYGVEAEGKITFSGTSATEAGSYDIEVVDAEQFSATIDVSIGDTPTVIATAVKNAFTSTIFPKLPVVATSNIGDAIFTAVDKGTTGNFYGIKIKGSIAGITVALTAFTGGLFDPAYVAGQVPAYKVSIAVPQFLKTSVDAITGVLDARFNPSNTLLDGVAYLGLDDTFGNLTTLIDAKNSKSLVVMGNKLVPSPYPIVNQAQVGASILTPADWRVCEFMAIRSKRLETDAPISDFVFATNKDQFGGMALASLPYHNTPLANTAVTPASLLFTEAEKALLETSGFTVIDVNTAENAMLMGSAVTTYKTNALGIADKTFKYLNFVDTGSVCREYLLNNMKNDFAQSRLTEGDTVPDRNIHNASSIKSKCMEYCADLAEETLVQGGGKVMSAISDAMTVTLDLANRTVTIVAEKFPIVTEIGTVNMAITMTFSAL